MVFRESEILGEEVQSGLVAVLAGPFLPVEYPQAHQNYFLEAFR